MEVLTDTLEKISLLVAIWVAIYGIDSWRREHLWKRKIELAEDALALFYEAKDAISFIRHPASSNSETSSIEKGEHESQKDFEARRNASIVFIRYEKHSELFNKIHAMRYRFMSIIGKDKAKPFDDLRGIENEIFRSARILARLWSRDRFQSEVEHQKHIENLLRNEEIFWGVGGDEDPIEPKIAKVIEDIETICSSVINSEKSLHKMLTKPLGRKR